MQRLAGNHFAVGGLFLLGAQRFSCVLGAAWRLRVQAVEAWRSVPWNPERYAVSDLGRVRNVCTGKILKQRRTTSKPNSPLHVTLYRTPEPGGGNCRKDTGSEWARKIVARLVLETFVGPAPEHYVARHKDLDETNNTPSNLYWGEKDYSNMLGRWATKLDRERVREIRRKLASGERVCAIAREFGVTHMLISRIKNGWAWREPGMPNKRAKKPQANRGARPG